MRKKRKEKGNEYVQMFVNYSYSSLVDMYAISLSVVSLSELGSDKFNEWFGELLGVFLALREPENVGDNLVIFLLLVLVFLNFGFVGE